MGHGGWGPTPPVQQPRKRAIRASLGEEQGQGLLAAGVLSGGPGNVCPSACVLWVPPVTTTQHGFGVPHTGARASLYRE